MPMSILISILLALSPLSEQYLPQVPSEILSDSSSTWKGFKRYHFLLNGREAFITAPHKALDSKEWVWRARFPEWHTEMDVLLLEAGFHIAFINADNLFGSPPAMQIWDAFYIHMTDSLRFARKVSLEGVSRGGLSVFNWAKRNPWKVHSIYTEAPVCDFKSWPGGFFSGTGGSHAWQDLKEAYGFKNDEEALAYQDNPLDNLEELVQVEGVDAVLIGPNDLSISLGIPDDYDHPKFKQAVQYLADIARKHGVGAGVHYCSQPIEREFEYIDWGCNLVIHLTDTLIIAYEIENGLQALRSHCGDEITEVDAAPQAQKKRGGHAI